VKIVQSCRKFWGRVTNGRWKVVNNSTGKVVSSHRTRELAQEVSSDLNEELQFAGLRSRYQTRWM